MIPGAAVESTIIRSPLESTIIRSPLDKPLGLLTEDDISQLTREDCRRYLKEKGMRRPSWNKSQAIEQVISLKSLLETRTESDAGGGGGGEGGGILRQRIIAVPQPPEIPVQVNSSNTETDSVPSSEKEKATSADYQVSVSVNESVPCRGKDPPKSGDLSCRPLVSSDANTTSLRNMRATTGSVGQMTIFYCGEINVYDGMSAEKARFIMQLAASPSDFPQDTPLAGTSAVQPLPCRSQAASAKLGLTSTAVSPTLQSAVPDNSRQYWEEGTTFREAEPEGPTNRKASLQRYLEKRKDRGKFKIKKKIVGSSNLEMYLNHPLRSQNSNEQSSPSGTCSPPQPRPPHTSIRCNSLENQADNMALSVDLNSNEVIEV